MDLTDQLPVIIIINSFILPHRFLVEGFLGDKRKFSAMSRKQATYEDALSQMVLTTAMFNSGVSNSSVARRVTCPTWYMEKIFFTLLFLVLAFIATIAVFARNGIDTWIQFSLYVVPLFSMLYGHLIFKSRTFRALLQRNLHGNLPRERENEPKAMTTCYPSRKLYRFLRKQSLKTCFYPLCLVLYQWATYLIFFYVSGNNSFSGESITPKFRLDKDTWFPIYCTFWTVGMYVTGFIGCSFIAVVEILKLDVKHFLHQLGNSPFTQRDNTVHKSKRAFSKPEVYVRLFEEGAEKISSTVKLPYRLLSIIVGFLTLGVIELIPEPLFVDTPSPLLYENTGEYTPGNEDRVSDSGITEERCDGEVPRRQMSPKEASENLTCLLANIETNSSLFQPFLVLLTFFSITNLVTHVVAIVSIQIVGFTALHWWTLARTFFWLILAMRLLWTAAIITKYLARVMPHIYYLRSVGELPGRNEEWENFIQLAKTFKLGRRAYGFPLSLNQVASIVAMINFSFLIVISLISNKQK